MTGNRWLQTLATNPGHSAWYIERWRTMEDEGKDLHGEARFVDAMVGRGARILDAGCGQGRVGGRLAQLGHHVVGVDIDPALVAAAEEQFRGATWHVGDLAELDLGGERFDAIGSAGNVVTFIDPSTLGEVLRRLGDHLAPEGRLAVGFGAGRDLTFDDFFAEAAGAGLRAELRLSTWDLRPFTPESDFLVAVLTR